VIRATVDTNILIYAVDIDAGSKHVLAARVVEILSEHKSVLPLQCLSEFYQATTKKHTLEAADAASLVQQFHASMEVIPSTVEDLMSAMQIHQQHSVQFFDALLIATARRAGCHTFFTEDMQDGRSFEGITIRSPFRLSPEELSRLLT